MRENIFSPMFVPCALANVIFFETECVSDPDDDVIDAAEDESVEEIDFAMEQALASTPLVLLLLLTLLFRGVPAPAPAPAPVTVSIAATLSEPVPPSFKFFKAI